MIFMSEPTFTTAAVAALLKRTSAAVVAGVRDGRYRPDDPNATGGTSRGYRFTHAEVTRILDLREAAWRRRAARAATKSRVTKARIRLAKARDEARAEAARLRLRVRELEGAAEAPAAQGAA